MEPLKIKDNTSYNSSIMLNFKNLTNCILNKTLYQLEHEGLFIFPRSLNNSEDLTRDQFVLQTINYTHWKCYGGCRPWYRAFNN